MEGKPSRSRLLPGLAAAAFVAMIHGVLVLAQDPAMVFERFADGDGYLRLVRVLNLAETGNWLDGVERRANAPFGFESHWTRPLDVLLLLLAMPLEPFLGPARAIHWAGLAVSPLVHVSTALALAWAAVPLLGRAGAALAAAIGVTQMGTMALMGWGVADHHALYLLTVVLVLGALTRSFGPAERGGAVAAGFAIAFGLWVGVEFLAVLGLALAVCGLAWVAGEPRGVERARALSLAFLAGIGMALLAERGPAGLAVLETDRISALHLVLAGLLVLAWEVLARWRPDGPVRRLGAGLGTGGAVLAALLVLSPRLVPGTVGDIPALAEGVLVQIIEHQPVGGFGGFLVYLGSGLLALPMLGRRLWLVRGTEGFWPWMFVAAGTLLFGAMTVEWLRWASYAGLFFCLPLADLVGFLDRRIDTWRSPGLRTAARPLIVLGLLAAPPVAGAILQEANGEKDVPSQQLGCGFGDLARVLGTRPRIVLTDVNIGAEILYRTPHAVLATLHHRNHRGIADSVLIMRAEDDGEARRRMAERGVDSILICSDYGGNHFARPGDGDRSGLLYRRLLENRPPDWLQEGERPSGTASGYRLFEVRP
ncbi:MAG: hypothetical protein H7841_09140 [Magnetospirillum sp. WYHS-4]